MTQTFVVTGANRGIGLEVCRQLATHSQDSVVYLTARNAEQGKQAVNVLHDEGLEHVVFHPLDITQQESIDAFVAYLEQKDIWLDVLINNAGVAAKGSAVTHEIATQTLGVNFFGTEALTIALRRRFCPKARIINVSSGMGALGPYYDENKQAVILDPSLTQEQLYRWVDSFLRDVLETDDVTQRGWPASTYAVSKAAMNALTRMWAATWTENELWFASVCPGWVRTDMGGPHASRSVSEGAQGIVGLALGTESEIGESGQSFRDGQTIPW